MREGRYRVRRATAPLPDALRAVDAVLADPRAEVLQAGARATVVAWPADGRALVLKRFRERALEALVLGSGAMRVWRAAARLRAAGFAVPEMIAVLERRRFGLPAWSCTVAARVGGERLDALWARSRGAARRRVSDAFADYLRGLHAAGLYPQDLRAANVLVAPAAAPTFVLVDLDRVRAYRRLSWARRRKNVVQVLRSAGRGTSTGERWRFLRRYLGAPNRAELRRRADEILAEARAKDAEYARRRGVGSR